MRVRADIGTAVPRRRRLSRSAVSALLTVPVGAVATTVFLVGAAHATSSVPTPTLHVVSVTRDCTTQQGTNSPMVQFTASPLQSDQPYALIVTGTSAGTLDTHDFSTPTDTYAGTQQLFENGAGNLPTTAITGTLLIGEDFAPGTRFDSQSFTIPACPGTTPTLHLVSVTRDCTTQQGINSPMVQFTAGNLQANQPYGLTVRGTPVGTLDSHDFQSVTSDYSGTQQLFENGVENMPTTAFTGTVQIGGDFDGGLSSDEQPITIPACPTVTTSPTSPTTTPVTTPPPTPPVTTPVSPQPTAVPTSSAPTVGSRRARLFVSRTTVGVGAAEQVTGTGFIPNERVSLSLHSVPVHLATAHTGADGSFSASVLIPVSTAAGTHEIEAVGLSSGRAAGVSITVSSGASSSSLPFTGEPTALLLGIAGGLLGLGAGSFSLGRKRRSGAR